MSRSGCSGTPHVGPEVVLYWHRGPWARPWKLTRQQKAAASRHRHDWTTWHNIWTENDKGLRHLTHSWSQTFVWAFSKRVHFWRQIQSHLFFIQQCRWFSSLQWSTNTKKNYFYTFFFSFHIQLTFLLKAKQPLVWLLCTNVRAESRTFKQKEKINIFNDVIIN